MLNSEIQAILNGEYDGMTLEEALKIAVLRTANHCNYDISVVEDIITNSKIFKNAPALLQERIIDYIKEICEQYQSLSLLQEELQKEEIKNTLSRYFTEDEIKEIFDAVYNSNDETNEVKIEKSDTGYSLKYSLCFKSNLKYIPEAKQFVIWDKKRWKKISNFEVENLIANHIYYEYQLLKPLIDLVKDEELKQQIQEEISFLFKIQNYEKIKRIVNLLKGNKNIVKKIHHFDRNIYLINLQNGILDLKNLKLLPHSSQYYITKIANVNYREDVDCPNWKSFLKEILVDNELIEFIQRVAGYILTGSTQENVIFILYGTGANGKTTFIRAFQDILNDYAVVSPAETFLVDGYKNIRNDLARLDGARLILVSEIEEEKRLAEALVKQFTGGDKIVARFLYSEYFEYQPTGKIFLITNKKPIIRGTDYAIWRRILLIPFETVIPPEKQIKNYYELFLKPELEGIFKWMVEGYQKYLKEGLNPPEKVKIATDEYKKEMDIVSIFINDSCELRPDAFIPKKELYEAFKKWAEETGYEILSKKRFCQILKEKGFGEKKSGSLRYFKGITLKDDISLFLGTD